MKKLLIIGYVWPEPGSSAAGRRMMEIIQLFLSQSWLITFASPAAKSAYQFDLSALGIDEVTIELNHKSFDVWLASLSPNAVVFDRFMMEEQFGWRVATVCPKAVRILDSEDLHFLRFARQQSIHKKMDLTVMDLKNETAVREVASIFRCDLSLIISSFERELLKQDFKIDENILHYLPFMVDDIKTTAPAFSDRKGFIFVGTVRHAPNLDAIRHLKKVLWPQIRKQLPDAQLTIIGSYPTKEVMQMHHLKQGFCVEGHVDDLEPFLLSARVSLAPLRFGAGLKGKLLEAMRFGLPSVTTLVGAEGIALKDQWPGFVAKEDAFFIEAAVRLHQEQTFWNHSVQTGFDILERSFSFKEHSVVFYRRLKNIMDDIEQHRQANFIGKMLQHHTLRSTEYMARWIECKNKDGS